MIKISKLIAAFFVTSIFLSGCNKNDNANDDQTPEETIIVSKDWKYDEEYHWHTTSAKTNNITDKAKHSMVESINEPTYDEEGYTHHECSVCGYSFNDNIVDKLKYKITFVDQNNNIIDEQEIYKGETPVFAGVLPTKESDVQYHYVFDSWYPEINEATCDVTYSPVFSSTLNEYTVTWKNRDGTTIEIESYAYGDMPSYKGKVPTTKSDDLLKYWKFVGWDRDLTQVTGNCEYTAQFELENAYSFVLTSSSTFAITQCKMINEEEIVLPTKYLSDINVTAIQSTVFNNFTNLKSIFVPDSYKSIEKGAFNGCTSIETMRLPFCGPNSNGDYLYTIFGTKSDAPQSLNKLTFGEGCSKIPNWAFTGFPNICEVNFPDTLKTIGKSIFPIGSDCIKKLVIPSSVTSIVTESTDASFRFCTNLEEIEMPIIGSSFYPIFETSLDTIKKVILKNSSTTVLPTYYFSAYRSTKIESIVLPENLTEIGSKAFSCSEFLKSVTIHQSVTSIRASAFYGCISLSEINLPSNLEILDDYVFEKCSSLRNVVLPNNLQSIGKGIFKDCTALEEVTMPFISSSIIEQTGFCRILFDYSIPENFKNLYISNSFTSLPQYAFNKCEWLYSYSVPNDVNCIDSYCFMDCTNLKSIQLPDSLTKIDNYAFLNCKSLESITIPNSVKYLGGGVFKNCTSLKSITIPSSVVQIRSSLFIGCTSLETVIFNDSPDQSIYAYQFFKNCISLKNVKLPNSLAKLEDEMFYGCTSLTNIEIPSTVTSIYNSFRNCTSLTEITLHDGITSIGYGSFANCSSLAHIELPNSLTNIGSSAFMGCSSLASIHIPKSVTNIGNGIFENCVNLTKVTGLDETSIGALPSYAFYNCISLREVTLSNIVYYDSYCFYNCSSLEISLFIGEEVTAVYSNAFIGCHIPFYYYSTMDQFLSNSSKFTGIPFDYLYFYEENEPTSEGNFWHYVDSVPTIW